MPHPFSWFEEQKGKTIKRIAYDRRTDKEKVSYQPVTDKSIDYLYGLQSKTIRFEVNAPRSHGYKKDKEDDPFTSDKPVIRIHKSGLSECEACQA